MHSTHTIGRARKTYVEKDECVSEECESITKGKDKTVSREKGENLYLRFQVEDIGEKGISHVKEIEEMVREIKEDCEKKAISDKKMFERLNFLVYLISKSDKGEMALEANKKKALEIINAVYEEYGKTERKLRKTSNRSKKSYKAEELLTKKLGVISSVEVTAEIEQRFDINTNDQDRETIIEYFSPILSSKVHRGEIMAAAKDGAKRFLYMEIMQLQKDIKDFIEVMPNICTLHINRKKASLNLWYSESNPEISIAALIIGDKEIRDKIYYFDTSTSISEILEALMINGIVVRDLHSYVWSSNSEIGKKQNEFFAWARKRKKQAAKIK